MHSCTHPHAHTDRGEGGIKRHLHPARAQAKRPTHKGRQGRRPTLFHCALCPLLLRFFSYPVNLHTSEARRRWNPTRRCRERGVCEANQRNCASPCACFVLCCRARPSGDPRSERSRRFKETSFRCSVHGHVHEAREAASREAGNKGQNTKTAGVQLGFIRLAAGKTRNFLVARRRSVGCGCPLPPLTFGRWRRDATLTPTDGI